MAFPGRKAEPCGPPRSLFAAPVREGRAPQAVRLQAGDTPPASVPHRRGEQSPSQTHCARRGGQAETAVVSRPRAAGAGGGPGDPRSP